MRVLRGLRKKVPGWRLDFSSMWTAVKFCLFCYRLYGIPPEFRDGVHLFIYNRHTYAIGSVPSLSGHAIAHRWRSLPRVRRHGASKPQGSSGRVLPWQVTMGQLIFASLSRTHYWYEVGMLEVPVLHCFRFV